MSDSEQDGFSAAEKAAMKERAKEIRAPKKRMTKAEKAQQARKEVEEKIASFEGNDKVLAEKLHRIITATAPELEPKTWYGMPAWADENGKAVCFFKAADKFTERYATFGFNPNAKLDEGNMWPTSYAVLKLGAAEEKAVVEMIKKAVGA